MGRSSSTTPEAAVFCGANAGAAAGTVAGVRLAATSPLTLFAGVGGDVGLADRVDHTPSPITAITASAPSSHILTRYRRADGAIGVAVLTSTTAVLGGTGSAADNNSGVCSGPLLDPETACSGTSGMRGVETGRSEIGVDSGLRKLLTNASNSSDVRRRASRAASIESRKRSSSASAAFSSNVWTSPSLVTRPPLSQRHPPRKPSRTILFVPTRIRHQSNPTWRLSR